ncbi:hypothetical protein BXZ70DRAFT_230036 [Cristinia sonorae]|uniref:Zn(2)-C6 fungal-type domain-containing protein n=1 Tax=Cristinia sonorae TaxID=1940300 RepID=A0A8K0XP23_9AGAR|nr:hypothetical protein BXZ70DRAFT_230036 [Cristinia sonorae]
MRSYPVSPVSSTSTGDDVSPLNSYRPSPISSRSTSPRPGSSGVQDTPQYPGPPAGQGQQVDYSSLFVMPEDSQSTQPDNWGNAIRAQAVWSRMAAAAPSGPPHRLSAAAQSEPGLAAPYLAEFQYYKPGSANKNMLFVHQPPPAVSRAAMAMESGPYQVTEFVHVPQTGTPAASTRLRTQKACETCRHRKAKCSGDRPVCGRCDERGLRCTYDDDTRAQRLEIRRERYCATRAARRGISSVERSRLRRRRTAQEDDVLQVNGQTYVAVDGNGRQERRRGYADGDVDMDMGTGAPGPSSASTLAPLARLSQAESYQYGYSEPGFGHMGRESYSGPGVQSDDDETELVIVEVPKGSKGRNLVDMLNPVAVHSLSALRAMHKDQRGQKRHAVTWPATVPTLPPMIDPRLQADHNQNSTSSSSSSSSSPAPTAAPTPARPRPTRFISVASLLSFPQSSTGPNSQTTSSPTSSSDTESIGVPRGDGSGDADDDMSIGWLETAKCVRYSEGSEAGSERGYVLDEDSRSFSFSIPSEKVSTFSELDSAMVPCTIPLRESSELSSPSRYSVDSAVGVPYSQFSSGSSTSSAGGASRYIGLEDAETADLQELFVRLMGPYASPTTSPPPSPHNEAPAAPRMSHTLSAPATIPTVGSRIPRPVGYGSIPVPPLPTRTVAAPVPPPLLEDTQSEPPLPSPYSPDPLAPSLAHHAMSEPLHDASSPEFSYGSFMSASGDTSAAFGNESSLFEEMFNFDEFELGNSADMVMGKDVSDEGYEAESSPIIFPTLAPYSTSPVPTTAANTDTEPDSEPQPGSPEPTSELPTSTSETSTLGDHSKSLMEEVLSFSLAPPPASTISASASLASCATEVSLESSGSFGDVVMASPVMVQ